MMSSISKYLCNADDPSLQEETASNTVNADLRKRIHQVDPSENILNLVKLTEYRKKSRPSSSTNELKEEGGGTFGRETEVGIKSCDTELNISIIKKDIHTPINHPNRVSRKGKGENINVFGKPEDKSNYSETTTKYVNIQNCCERVEDALQSTDKGHQFKTQSSGPNEHEPDTSLYEDSSHEQINPKENPLEVLDEILKNNDIAFQVKANAEKENTTFFQTEDPTSCRKDATSYDIDQIEELRECWKECVDKIMSKEISSENPKKLNSEERSEKSPSSLQLISSETLLDERLKPDTSKNTECKKTEVDNVQSDSNNVQSDSDKVQSQSDKVQSDSVEEKNENILKDNMHHQVAISCVNYDTSNIMKNKSDDALLIEEQSNASIYCNTQETVEVQVCMLTQNLIEELPTQNISHEETKDVPALYTEKHYVNRTHHKTSCREISKIPVLTHVEPSQICIEKISQGRVIENDHNDIKYKKRSISKSRHSIVRNSSTDLKNKNEAYCSEIFPRAQSSWKLSQPGAKHRKSLINIVSSKNDLTNVRRLKQELQAKRNLLRPSSSSILHKPLKKNDVKSLNDGIKRISKVSIFDSAINITKPHISSMLIKSNKSEIMKPKRKQISNGKSMSFCFHRLQPQCSQQTINKMCDSKSLQTIYPNKNRLSKSRQKETQNISNTPKSAESNKTIKAISISSEELLLKTTPTMNTAPIEKKVSVVKKFSMVRNNPGKRSSNKVKDEENKLKNEIKRSQNLKKEIMEKIDFYEKLIQRVHKVKNKIISKTDINCKNIISECYTNDDTINMMIQINAIEKQNLTEQQCKNDDINKVTNILKLNLQNHHKYIQEKLHAMKMYIQEELSRESNKNLNANLRAILDDIHKDLEAKHQEADENLMIFFQKLSSLECDNASLVQDYKNIDECNKKLKDKLIWLEKENEILSLQILNQNSHSKIQLSDTMREKKIKDKQYEEILKMYNDIERKNNYHSQLVDNFVKSVNMIESKLEQHNQYLESRTKKNSSQINKAEIKRNQLEQTVKQMRMRIEKNEVEAQALTDKVNESETEIFNLKRKNKTLKNELLKYKYPVCLEKNIQKLITYRNMLVELVQGGGETLGDQDTRMLDIMKSINSSPEFATPTSTINYESLNRPMKPKSILKKQSMQNAVEDQKNDPNSSSSFADYVENHDGDQ